MAERGIIFSGPMVRALLDGRKTQTRRLIKPQPPENITSAGVYANTVEGVLDKWTWLGGDPRDSDTWEVGDDFKTGYRPGDRLYVRESCRAEELDDGLDGVRFNADGGFCRIKPTMVAGMAWSLLFYYRGRGKGRVGNSVPSIHMPRWASRLTLTVTEVRVQRLQEISEDDAIAEGLDWCAPGKWTIDRTLPIIGDDERIVYSELWNTLHDKPGERWADNPWIVAVSFDVRRGNIDDPEAGE